MTIHGSKSEFKQLRYLENCVGHVSLLPEAITFYPTIDFQFLQCSGNQTSIPFQGNQYHLNHSPRRPPNMQSKLDKKKKKLLTSTYLTLCTLKGHRALGTMPSSINTLRPPRFQKKKKMNFRHFGAFFGQLISLSLQNTHKNH